MSDPWDSEFHDDESSTDKESTDHQTGEPEELLRPTADEPATDDDSPEALLHPTGPDDESA